jgi:predicted CXXCH cytochrome family protein
MPFCLVRDRDGEHSTSTHLSGSRLTIGSAADQRLQLPIPGVDRRHAVLSTRRNGMLRLTVRSARGVLVNGVKVREAVVSPGDRLEIGAAVIIVLRQRGAQLAALHIQEPEAPAALTPGRGEDATGGFSMSFWSWSLVVAVTVLCLLVPWSGLVLPVWGKVLRSTPLLPSDALWNPGPLHTAHLSIGSNCNACHRKPFEPVRDTACATCHADVQHHVDARSHDAGLFQGEHCTSCHREHKQPAALVQSDPRLCTDCHGHLERIKPDPAVADVTDFGRAHPEFRLSVLAASGSGRLWQSVRLERSQPGRFVERSHLRFSHAQHLNPMGVKTPQGDRVLTCQECHRPDPSGREMAPISMTTVCASCHSLRFDEQDPSSALPHGDLLAAIRTVREHFSRQYLETGLPAQPAGSGTLRRPGGSALAQPGADESAVAWVDEQATKVARELMEKRVCVECHEVVHRDGRNGPEQWQIRPVRLTTDWMPFARFNHAAHSTQKCSSCHTAAEHSERASDILIPGITKCRECHSGAEDTSKVASSCLMCHQFHLPNHGRFLKTSSGERTERR